MTKARSETIQIIQRDSVIATMGSVAKLSTRNLPGVPIRIVTQPTVREGVQADGTKKDVYIRRGAVLVYSRELESWVCYRGILRALASTRHTRQSYGIDAMVPRGELQRLDAMLLNLDGANDIMSRYGMMDDEERARCLDRLKSAAREYRMPRIPEKIRASTLLMLSAQHMMPPTDPHPGRGRGVNPSAAMSRTVISRTLIVGRQGTIRRKIDPRIHARFLALAAELEYCLAVFGEVARDIEDVLKSPILKLPSRTHLEEITNIEQPLQEWRRAMNVLAGLAHRLRDDVFPAPYARYASRMYAELLRAAIELECRNFEGARTLAKTALSSIDYLTLAERIMDAKSGIVPDDRQMQTVARE